MADNDFTRTTDAQAVTTAGTADIQVSVQGQQTPEADAGLLDEPPGHPSDADTSTPPVPERAVWPPTTTGEFLKTLWGNIPPGKVLIWTLPDKKSRWYSHFENVTADMRFHEKEDVYTGVGLAPHEGLRLPSNKRLKEWEVAGIAAFWADIDVAHPAHKTAKQYPPSIEKALEALAPLPFAATIIVDSGHGVQLWWVLKEVWIFEDEADRERARRASQWWHQVVKGIFAEHGWDVDSTFDLPRVMRLPGTWNNKEPEDRRRVEVTGGCGERYDRQQFLDLVPDSFRATPMGARRNRSDGNGSGGGFAPGYSGLVLDPEAEPSFTRIQTLLKLEPKFSKTWEMQRPDLADQSASAYDMALANYAVRAGWPDQEVANLLIAFRRRNGLDPKLREDYYAVTIAKAHEPLEQQAEVNGTSGSVSTDGASAAGSSSAGAASRVKSRNSPLYEFGAWYAKEYLAKRFLYDARPDSIGWWFYDGLVWRALSTKDPRLVDEISRDRYTLADELRQHGHGTVAKELIQKTAWKEAKYRTSDMWSGLRNELTGLPPAPKSGHLGTPKCVVDLRTGEEHPHHHSFGIRAITRGLYLPGDEQGHTEAFQSRFNKVFAPQVQVAFLKLVGLAMTGRAQSYRAFVMIVGPSGSGKGDAINVILYALDDLGMGVGSHWLMNRRTEIDSTSTDILEYKPAIITMDEVGMDTEVGTSRLMTLTGNAALSSRRPNGPNIRGRITAQLWTTAVVVPSVSVGAGMNRRLAVLPTLRELKAWEINEEGNEAQPLLDAVVTLSALQAQEFYQPGYRAPVGDPSAKGETLRNMDEVAAWLEDQDDLDGISKKDLLERARDALDKPELTDTMLGNRVRTSTKWMPRKSGDRTVVRRPRKGEQEE